MPYDAVPTVPIPPRTGDMDETHRSVTINGVRYEWRSGDEAMLPAAVRTEAAAIWKRKQEARR
jgi:hypothetical protein